MNKLLIGICMVLTCSSAHATKVDSTSFYGFGKVKVYYSSRKPSNFVIFISGDGGWNKGVVNMARAITSLDAMVVGVDVTRYFAHLHKLSSACYYPASDFENLSKFIQKRYRFTKYINPVIIGYSSGATLAYGILAQAPENTFKGAMGLGFCPDIEISKPLCKGAGLKIIKRADNKGFDLQPSPLTSPFVALLGEKDEVCDPKLVQEFITKAPKSELVPLPKVGHGFAVQKNWMPQFIESFHNLLSYDDEKKAKFKPTDAQSTSIVKPKDLEDFPLKIVPSNSPTKSSLIFMISGDGGWTGFDQELASHMSKLSFPVVGLDALQYFWSEKKPETVAKAITPILEYYMAEWDCKDIILMGYSFGADFIPFLENKLAPEIKNKVKMVALLSPYEWADFEIHISDMFNILDSDDDNNVKAELLKTNCKTLLIFGSEEVPNKFEDLPKIHFKQLVIPGGHHYGNNFEVLTSSIVQTFHD
jgi:type IV secretory pathway VirJ component